MSALSQPATSQRHPLSVAVIGAGMAGRTHANAWRQVGTVFGSEGIPPIRLAAICDSYEPFARSARDSYGYERAVTDWHDIVDADDIDVVSVVVSNALHRQVAEDLVRAGKHVLCEKPLSDSLKNARAMAELEANSQVVTGVGFSYRRHPSVAAIAELVRQGRLGDVTTFSGRYWCGYGVDHRADGMALSRPSGLGRPGGPWFAHHRCGRVRLWSDTKRPWWGFCHDYR